jgi:hypothetical protein
MSDDAAASSAPAPGSAPPRRRLLPALGPASRFLLRRLAMVMPILFGVLLFTFVLVRLGGQDPVVRLAGPTASAQQIEEVRAELGLDKPILVQFGIYVAKVLDRKVSRGQVFLVTDGGLHHHLAASGNFGQVIRKNYPVVVGTRMDATDVESSSIVGPLCTPLDLLGDRMELPRAEPGDLVCVLMSGAYGYTSSPHLFLSHPAPVEVLV